MITPERLKTIGSTEAVRELSGRFIEVRKALNEQHEGMNYDQCLEMMVITLANRSEHYESECIRLMMSVPDRAALQFDEFGMPL